MKATARRRIAARADRIFDDLFLCPSCSTWRKRLPARLTSVRRQSTLVSSTAIGASRQVPEEYKPLHEALLAVGSKASAQVSLSRLQLAIQSLESRTPKTRVAILGLDVATTARRLVKLLLADALVQEPRWERLLLGTDEYPNGLLVRYGQLQNPDLQSGRTPIPTLTIPASVLERGNVEILISSVSSVRSDPQAQTTTPDMFLSPTVGTPTSSTGHMSQIRQPVHKSLVVASNLDELVRALQLISTTAFASDQERGLVHLAVNIEGQSSGTKVLAFDAVQAEEALESMRSSVANSMSYEASWKQSGMPDLSGWLTRASTSSPVSLDPPVQDLIAALLDATGANIVRKEKESTALAEASNISDNTRSTLHGAITTFSQQAHQELQTGLAAAWSSRNWRKLAWYKLFWRVDDVSLIVNDLVSNAWLPQTERRVYEISGRLLQAGIPPAGFEEAVADVQVVATEPATATMGAGSVLASASADFAVASIPGQSQILLAQNTLPTVSALSSSISSARTSYITRAISDLTFSAQQLVFRALSITGLSAGLSGLSYFSVTAGSIYESATIVAVGTVFALRGMQKGWGRQCQTLEDGLMEAGRDVLRSTENRMRELVDGKQVEGDQVEIRAREEARAAVSKAQSELAALLAEHELEKLKPDEIVAFTATNTDSDVSLQKQKQ